MHEQTKSASLHHDRLVRRRESLLKRVGWFPGQTTKDLHRGAFGSRGDVGATEELLRGLAARHQVVEVGRRWWLPASAPAAQVVADTEPELVGRLRSALADAPEGLTRAEMGDELDVSPHHARRALKHLKDRGEVIHVGVTQTVGRPAVRWGLRSAQKVATSPKATVDLEAHRRGFPFNRSLPTRAEGRSTEAPHHEVMLELDAARRRLAELLPRHAPLLDPMLEAVLEVLRRIGDQEAA